MKHWKIALGTSLIAFVILVALVSNFTHLPIKSCIDAYDIDNDGTRRLVNRGQLLTCKLTTVAILVVAGLAASPLIGLVGRRK